MNIADAHILIVDDVEDNRTILVRRMKRLGFHHLAEAEDGVEAIDHIRSHPVDLVLLDVMMPRMNGVEVLEAMRLEGRLEDTSAIMISAASEIETVVKCLDLGADDYLPKPFNPSILRARIGSVLEKKALRAEVKRQLARLETELAVARRQQLSMVSTLFPPPGSSVDLHAVMRPALEVGGDVYDFFPMTQTCLAVAIGDVSGKGMPAALFMARTRSLLRAGALQFLAIRGQVPKPSELAAVLNDELCKNNEGCLYITLIVGFLDLDTGRFDYVNAGHLPPIVVSPTRAAEMAAAPDPPLGVVEEAIFADRSFTIGREGTLVLITDGLPDMEDADRRPYGLARLLADLDEMAAETARGITEGLAERVTVWADAAPQFDDVTVLAVRLA